jgi:preprotein translocase subunit SecB
LIVNGILNKAKEDISLPSINLKLDDKANQGYRFNTKHLGKNLARKESMTMPVHFSIKDIRLLKLHFFLDPQRIGGDEDEGVPVEIEIACKSNYDEKQHLLRVDLLLKSKDASPSFNFNVEVGGIFLLDEKPSDEELFRLRTINCPAILFPYVREIVSDLTRRAGLSPLHLPPANFVEIAKTISRQGKNSEALPQD